MVQRKFRTISEYDYTNTNIPLQWQAWHEAYFRRISSILHQPDQAAKLVDWGCVADGWDTPNCTRTCGNSTAMFSSPENLWNCVALATVTMAVVPGDDTVDPEHEREVDDMFHIGSWEEFDQLRVFRNVRECFWQSCSDSKYGRCTEKLADYRCNSIDQINMWDFGDLVRDNYCQDADMGIDSDIAGPGVLIAYIIQYGLVILLGFSYKLTADRSPSSREEDDPRETLTTRLKRMISYSALGSLFHQSPSYLPAFISSRIPGNLSDLLAARFAQSVHATVFDLQEAQLLFVATFSLLSIVAFIGNGAGLANIGSVFSYIVNREIATGLVFAGMYPVLLLQLYFHRAGRRWLYTLVLSCVDWLLVVVYSAQSKKPVHPKRFWKNLKETSAVAACGGNPGPMSYCLGPLQGHGSEFFKLSVKLQPALHLLSAVVFLNWFLQTKCLRGWFRKRTKSWVGEKTRHLLEDSLWLLVQACALAMMGIGLYDVVSALSDMYLSREGGIAWGFGQLVALAIWIPVVAKFVYLFIVGAKEGTEKRVHSDLKVYDTGGSPPLQSCGESDTQVLVRNMEPVSVLGPDSKEMEFLEAGLGEPLLENEEHLAGDTRGS
ncbi:hypothetical protein ACJZ2D_000243 [Fusarium nematophilum]